jgi:dipeptidyl aminopeptidase/acylaminoacyl peptidase
MSSMATRGIAEWIRYTAGTVFLAALALFVPVWLGSGTALSALPGADGKIAFQSNRDGNFEVYVMNADGSHQIRLTDHRGFDGDPSWSPDGQRIAFRSNRDGNAEIYLMNADGTDPTRLTHDRAFDGRPAWSPDSQRIAFHSNRDGNAEIYVMHADGSGQTNLTNNPANDFKPTWSPDGQRIAFRSDRELYPRIYAMNADGSGQTKVSSLLIGTRLADAFPAWSPDGRKIAFDQSRDRNAEIYVMNADGSERTPLTNDPPNGGPAWSPDGQRVAFRSSRDGNAEIYVMNADGSAQTRLTNNSWADHRPDWHPSSLPANRFRFGRAIRNRRKGFTRLAVRVPGPGRVVLRRGKNVRWFARQANEAGAVGVRVRPRGRAMRRLQRAGAVRRRMQADVRVQVTFRPAGGWPRTQGTRVRLARIGSRR